MIPEAEEDIFMFSLGNNAMWFKKFGQLPEEKKKKIISYRNGILEQGK